MIEYSLPRLKINPLRGTVAFVFLAAALLLNGCGGSDEKAPEPMAQSSDVVAGMATAGPTPFISLVPLAGQSLKNVVSYRFVITPKAGAVSRQVDVTYTLASMMRAGHYNQGGATASLPVFGLHAGYANQVNIELIYSDSSRKTVPITITTAAYADPRGVYDRPNILKKRAAGGPELNFFFMKSQFAGPVVVDSDGEIRWVVPTPLHAYSSTFANDSFIIGAPAAVTFTRIALDGRTTSAAIATTSYTKFHHNIDPGKVGLLGEFDGVVGGLSSIESVVAEFAQDGTVLKEWDFADIIGRYMRSQGDDPSPFIRAGIDWFHVNAATYDRRDDSIIASSRENFVIKVDYKTGEIKWILGDPTKYWYTFPSLRAKALALEAGGFYPIGQHATSINASGDLMLFNDGAQSFNQPVGMPVGERRTYSTVSAYTIDAVRMTARETWRFDYGQTIFSDICSSAYEVKGGAILVNYSAASARTKSRMVGLDAARNVIFDFEYPSSIPCATSWNAEPIAFDGMIIQ
jgi:arylsulfate sulfotransferase